MKIVTRIALLASLVIAAVQFSGCLNDDNKIPPNCYDGILNNDEELVDCGGPNCPPCDPCENGIWEPELGEQWVDCGGSCPPCDVHFNGQLDPGEDCIDCGGITGVDCGELCNDGLPNGCEEEVDCGGPDCDPCPSCEDGIMNQDEIGIDCGGEECPPCTTEGDCTNGIIDGDELYIDCGGTHCPDCELVLRWNIQGSQFNADLNLNSEYNGGTINAGGVSSTPNGAMNVIFPEPAVLGWQPGTVIEATPDNFPQTTVQYVSAFGGIFSNQFDGSSITFTFEYIVPGAGGVAAGTFNGTLFNEENQSVTLNNGQFIFIFD